MSRRYFAVETSWGELLMVFGARNRAEAARIMLQAQRIYNDMHRVNEVFNLGKAHGLRRAPLSSTRGEQIMKTYDVTFSREVPFAFLMYREDTAPTRADVLAMLKRRGLSDKTMACMTWRVSVVGRPDFGGGKIAARERRPAD